MGIPVVNVTPSRGNDKISRAHSIAPLFEAGMIWAPDEQWAHELIEECAAFPNGEYDDYVDSCLVGESGILMADGSEKRLDQVRVGDWVQTPAGPRRVTRFLDQGVKEVWDVCVGGKVLTATSDHRLMTNRGWVRVDNIVPTVDTVALSNEGGSQWFSREAASFERQLCSTVVGTTGTQKAATRRTGSTLHERVAGFIETCGSFMVRITGTTCDSSRLLRVVLLAVFLCLLAVPCSAIATKGRRPFDLCVLRSSEWSYHVFCR